MSRVVGPSEDRQGDVAVGVEVQPGKNTGSMKVFDGGVPRFPDTHDGTAGGFTEINAASGITAGTPRNLNDLVQYQRSGEGVQLKWKRSITISTPSTNVGVLYVGDKYTNGTSSPKRGFPVVAGASLTLEITEGSAIYFDYDNGGACVFNWIAV